MTGCNELRNCRLARVMVNMDEPHGHGSSQARGT